MAYLALFIVQIGEPPSSAKPWKGSAPECPGSLATTQGISLERLMHALTALGQHVKIVVTPSRRGAPAGIKVAA